MKKNHCINTILFDLNFKWSIISEGDDNIYLELRTWPWTTINTPYYKSETLSKALIIFWVDYTWYKPAD